MQSSEILSGSLLKGLLDFAFPPLCLGCGEYFEQAVAVCHECLRRIQTYEFPFCLNCKQMINDLPECPNCRTDGLILFAFGNYVDPLKQIVVQFKFKGMTQTADFVAHRLVDRFRDPIAMLEVDALVPIPLHPAREHARGYNQAEIFAQSLSERLEIPVDMQILVRTRRRREQARLSDRERARNISGVFETIADAEPGESLILVDDVVTGGYTVMEAKRELVKAGFEVPAVISMAHGL